MKDPSLQIVDTDGADSTFVQVLMAVYEDFRDLETRLGKHLSADSGYGDDGSGSLDAQFLIQAPSARPRLSPRIGDDRGRVRTDMDEHRIDGAVTEALGQGAIKNAVQGARTAALPEGFFQKALGNLKNAFRPG